MESLGPYRSGLGKRGPESDQSSDEEKQVVSYSRKTKSSKLDPDLIQKFDPAINTSNSSAWLHKIDQLGEIYGWREKDRVYIMQIRLHGSAREWYDNLEDYNLSWKEWKELLTKSFPRATDFVDILEEMLKRKMGNETMTTYYHDKMNLIRRCKLDEEASLSCLIRGLPLELRGNAKAFNCSTPEQLYYGFLSSMENHQLVAKPVSTSVELRSSTRPAAHLRTAAKTCQICGGRFHEARDCRRAACQICSRIGHTAANCWFRSSSSTGASTSQRQQNLQVESILLTTSKSLLNHYYKQVSINGYPVLAYIDTGSRINIVSIGKVGSLGLPLHPTCVIMRGFGGMSIPSVGKVHFKLIIDDVTAFITAEASEINLPYIELIIGQTFLQLPYISLIVTPNSTTIIDTKSVSEPLYEPTLLDSIPPSRVELYTKKEIKISPKCHYDVEVATSHTIEPYYVYVTRPIVFELGKIRYYIPQAISATNTAVLRIFNLGEEDILWPRGKLLTRAKLYEYNQVLQVDQKSIRGLASTNATGNFEFSEKDVDTGDLNKLQKSSLFQLLQKYTSTFAKNSNDLGTSNLLEMHIETTTEKPVYHKPYRTSYKEREVIREKVDELLTAGIIRKSNSQYASPVILVKKKGGGYRLCVDYRALNALTVKDRYPLPHIEDEINKLSGKLYFTTLDLAQGYHQVNVAEDSTHKTAFITQSGLYEYVKVPFGLANGPAVFSRLIQMALGSLSDKIALYLDDVTIPSRTIAEGLALLEEVLMLLERACLKLNLNKCSFLKTTVNYLGHEVSAGSIRPGQAKIESVKNFRQPRNVHEIRQFLGLASYFRKYVKGFAEIARPLTVLTKKDVTWTWSSEQEKSFLELKAILTERPVLGIYDPKSKTELHTDASKLGLGGILMQYQSNESLKPIAYFSRVTTKEEQFYHSYELETLAVVESLKRFRIYLSGIHVKVVTDCAALRTTLTKKELVPRIARWWLAIQDFDIEIEYRSGKRMQHVDALSRNPVENTLVLHIDESDWCLTLQLQDDQIQSIIRQIEGNTTNSEIRNNYELIEGRLYRKTVNGNRFVIPKLSKWSLLQRCHDQAGHIGFEKCEKTIKTAYWFPGMTRFIRKYINSCIKCAYAKGNYGKLEGELNPIEKKAVPMHTLHVDHLGPFTKSREGNSYVLVVVDAFTKFVIARAVKKPSSLETIRHLKDIIVLFGSPFRVITDRGKAFTSRYFKEFATDTPFKHILNAIASPRSNGQVERVNRSIIDGLNTSTESECLWDTNLTEVIRGINNTPHSTTGYCPFQLMFSHDSNALVQNPQRDHDTVEVRTHNLQNRRKLAKSRIDKQMTTMKTRFDKSHKKCRKYQLGQLVLWKGGVSKIPTAKVTKKLGNNYTGPYQVIDCKPHINRYTIKSVRGMKGYKKFTAIVPAENLRPYKSAVSDSSSETEHEIDRDDLIDLLES